MIREATAADWPNIWPIFREIAKAGDTYAYPTDINTAEAEHGATMSRMEHTISNLSNIVMNTKAARSRINDADIAAESTELSKAQVLNQAAQAMLAQANKAQQSILQLLN